MFNLKIFIMRKITLTVLVAFLFGFAANAQSTLFEDDFESYNVGDYVAENSGTWTTWANNPGTAEDAVISDDYASSPAQSMHISGTNDMVLPLGDKTSGKYQVSLKMYVENDGSSEGYFNLQHFESPGVEWANEVYFNLDGTGHLDADGNSYTFNYTQDAWVQVDNIVDIDADTAALYIDGTHIHTWTFSTVAGGGAGEPQLGGMNIFAGAETGTPNFYVDDVQFSVFTNTIFTDDFESYNVGDYVAENSDTWTTWSNDPGTAEDAVIIDDYSNSPSQSMHISGTNDMVLPLGNKIAGQYQVNFYIYVENDGSSEGYYNLQHFESPGVEWANEVYFNLDGTAHLETDGNSTTFSYTQDAWVHVENFIDIDADTASLFIDGAHIHTWTFSTLANGGAGEPQLGGMNIFAGAETGTPNFYIDDVEYLGSGEAAPPTVSVDVTSITSTGADQAFNLSNVGELDLEYNIYPIYPQAKQTTYKPIKERILDHMNVRPMSDLVTVKNPQPNNTDISKDGTLTHVQGAFGGGVGYPSQTTVKAAARFQPGDIADVVGMEMTSVIVGINDLPLGDTATLMIWERGVNNPPAPGNLIYSETFSISTAGEQVLIDLASPIYLDGKDIWVGYMCEDPGDGLFPLGIDEGPRVDDANYLSTGVGWGEMSETIDGNLFVICQLTGDGISNWMSATPNEGTIAGSESEEITVSFDPTGLTTGTEYTGELVIASNDQETPYTNIDVSYTPGDTYTVTFNVMDEDDNAIEGANVNINGDDLTTDASGVATINLADGDYDYTVSKAGYFDATGTVTVAGAPVTEEVTLSLDAVNEISHNKLNIYPNPSTGLFNVKAEGNYEATIVNFTGQVVYQNTLNGNTVIDLSSQPAGVYFVRIKNNDNITNRRIVIE